MQIDDLRNQSRKRLLVFVDDQPSDKRRYNTHGGVSLDAWRSRLQRTDARGPAPCTARRARRSRKRMRKVQSCCAIKIEMRCKRNAMLKS